MKRDVTIAISRDIEAQPVVGLNIWGVTSAFITQLHSLHNKIGFLLGVHGYDHLLGYKVATRINTGERPSEL